MSYETDALAEVLRWRENFDRLSDRHKSLLPRFKERASNAFRAIKANGLFVQALLQGMSGPDAPPHLRDAYDLGVQHAKQGSRCVLWLRRG